MPLIVNEEHSCMLNFCNQYFGFKIFTSFSHFNQSQKYLLAERKIGINNKEFEYSSILIEKVFFKKVFYERVKFLQSHLFGNKTFKSFFHNIEKIFEDGKIKKIG